MAFFAAGTVTAIACQPAPSRTLTAYRLNAAIWESEGVSGNVQKLVTSRAVTNR